ncbi:hypothetical protein OIU92_01485 [Escherichia coli]|nr:hypothetical protein [Escherichia coli]
MDFDGWIGSAIEERQVQRKCCGTAPALKGGGKQREQRGQTV